MPEINAIIVGAGRSGTTSLFGMLKQHPDCESSSIKEVHYFSVDDLYKRGPAYLHSFFDQNSTKNCLLTADTYLFISEDGPKRLAEYNPKAKILLLLREPVGRAYSNFLYSKNFGYESMSMNFLETLEIENLRMQGLEIVQKNNLCHFYGSLYHFHLMRWLKHFPRKQFFIRTTESFYENPQQSFSDLCKFLNIADYKATLSETERNQAASARSVGLQQFLLNRNHPMRRLLRGILRPMGKWIIKSGLVERVSAINKMEANNPELSNEEWEAAAAYFKKDVLLLERDFGIRFKKHLFLYQ